MSDVKITQAAPARGSRRRRVRLFLVLGALFLLVGYIGLDLWAGHQVNVAIADLEKRYGRMDQYPLEAAPVPPGDNRARVVRAAAALVAFSPEVTDASVSEAYRHFLNSPAPVRVPAVLRDFIDAHRSGLRLADDVKARNRSSWEISYGHESGPPLLEIKGLTSAIYLVTLMDLEAGRPDDAAESIDTGLAVSGSLRQEPDLLAQLIRVATGMQQLEGVHHLLIESEPSKASLDALAKWLADDRTVDPARMALVSELKTVNATLMRLESGQSLGDDAPFWLGPFARLSRPVIRLAHARCLRQMGDLLDVQAGPRPRAASGPVTWQWSANSAWMRRLDKASVTSIAGLERSIDTFDRFDSALGATELAVALRRFRLDHGTYPDDLQALVPGYMASVPIDAFTGHSPTYARHGLGFHLCAEGAQQSQKAYSSWIVSAFDWVVPK